MNGKDHSTTSAGELREGEEKKIRGEGIYGESESIACKGRTMNLILK